MTFHNRSISSHPIRTGGRGGRRRGSVLVVVLALLSALMLLGFLFFTIASQERENARYFAASEKWYSAQLSGDELMDFALEQLILGPQDDLPNSALWGGRYSLLASLLGDDLQPYNGRGVNVADFDQLQPVAGTPGGPGNGQPYVDANANGVRDDPGAQGQLRLDLAGYAASLPAPGGGGFHNLRDAVSVGSVGFAPPDAGYTYPDLNSPFLAYVGREPMTGNQVIIPSFHRPQYLRGMFGAGNSANWYTDPNTQPYVLRPHAERTARVFNYGTGLLADSGIPRFEETFFDPVSDPEPGTTTDPKDPSEGYWDLAMAHSYDADPDGDGVGEAIYLDLDHPIEETADGTEKFIPLYAITVYDLDGLLNVNAHGNHYGTPANLASMPATPFDFLSRSNEGRRRNEVNTLYAWLGTPGPTGMPAGADYAQHQQFFGATPTTPTQLANMEWWFVLAGRGELNNGKATRIFPGRYGEANLLSDTLKAGAGTWRNAYAHARPGQTGSDEAAGVADGSRGSAYNDVNGQLFPPAVIFPAPRHPADYQGQGTFVLNDGVTPLLQTALAALPPGQQAALATLGRVRVPIYQNYWLPPQATSGIGPTWAYALGANYPNVVRLVTSALGGVGLTSSDGRLVDDPGETLLDAELARDQVTDSIFGPEETAALHMTVNDRTKNGIVSRLVELAPANLGDKTTDNLDRRRRLTANSSDLKAFTYTDPTGTARFWEVESVDANYPNLPTFPPRFLAPLDPQTGAFDPLEPFRPEARGLLASLPNMTSAPPNTRTVLKQLSRKLSVNHVAAAYVGRDGQPRYFLRPLTPHPGRNAAGQPYLGSAAVTRPTNLPNGPAVPQFGLSDQQLFAVGALPSSIPLVDHDGVPATPVIPNPALQEWHARRDRQNLARDIYTLLYTFGDPTATDVTTTNPYTTAQLVEMAQFAVNVVDAMDPDDAITCFVFDLNPTATGAGYTPADDGYADPVTTLADRAPDPTNGIDEDGDGNRANDLFHYIDGATGRGMVYGVEAQQLAFGEALALFAKKYLEIPSLPTSGKDHKATDWDDEEHRDFAFVELQNMTATPVPLAGGWSVVCRVNNGTLTSPSPRAVTLNDPAVAISPGTAFTVGTAGDAHNTDRPTPADARSPWTAANPTKARPSHFSVDLDGTEDTDPPAFTDYQRIAPVTPSLNFDLVEREGAATTRNTFRMTEVDPADLSRDQTAFGSVDDNDAATAGGTAPKAGGWMNLGTQTERDGLLSGTVTFYLRRRLNLNRTTPAQDTTNFPALAYTDAPAAPTGAQAPIERDNPWVIVDTIQVPLDVFDMTTATTVAAETDSVISDHRVQPLSNITATAPNYAATAYNDFNNLGVQSPGGAMTIWQRHFDRPFASLADLLIVPLYGPREVTEASAALNSTAAGDPRHTAAVNILFPDVNARPALAALTGAVPGALAPTYLGGNLWYRLFEFVEVPQKHGDHDGLPWFADYGGPSQWLSDPGQRQDWLRERLRLREFGKLNLNTMRHPHALAGLLDDPRVFAFMNDLPRFTTPPSGAGYLPSRGALGGLAPPNLDLWLIASSIPLPNLYRDWWVAMLASRDGGYDPYTATNAGQRAILPGVPSARPFLDFGSGPFAASPVASDFQRTLLRTIPADSDDNPATGLDPNGIEPTTGRRSLFELGNRGTGATLLLGSNAEFSTRYRLLGKVLNHGTIRSNTYVAFIEVAFFEAKPNPFFGDGDPRNGDHDNDDSTPAVYQIGKKREEDPYRGVFVIDRTLALELLRRRDLPPSAAEPNPIGLYPQNSKYRTYSFAREPGPDQRPQPTFDWRDLIQYRRILAQ